jgi:hypothetical protein
MSPEPSSWLLELGVSARTVELRAELQHDLGHPIRAWNSRRAGARARRELVRHVLAGSFVESGWHDTMELPVIAAAAPVDSVPVPVKVVALPPVQAEEPEPDVEPEPDEDGEELATASPATALLERIGAYTCATEGSTLSAR